MVRTCRGLGVFWAMALGFALLAGCQKENAAQTLRNAELTPFALTQTAYVQVLRAQKTATAGVLLTPSPSPTPSSPFPGTRAPTISLTPTPSLSPTAPTAVPATVTGNLYCREGPAPYYRAVALLEPGQRVQVVGQNPVYYAYRLVALPSGATCWAWVRWLDAQGPEEALPRVTPPPPPPGAFSLPRQYPTMSPFCPAFFAPALLVQVKNLTATPLRSMDVYIEVLDTGAVYHTYTPEGIPTCTKVRTQLQGHERATLAFRTPVDLTDRRIRLTLKACTQPHFQGACVSYAVVWTIEPPPRIPLPFPRP